MRRCILAPVATVAILCAAACMSDAPTVLRTGRAASADRGTEKPLPGSKKTGAFTGGVSVPINCIPKDPAYGSAVVGPSGGDLIIGPHRLVVPPGALQHDVLISGTVPDDRPFEIDLQPHGLQFKKPAGLILDASSCTSVPDIVYLIDQLTISDPIEAVYSNLWHTIACPIWHFSGYGIAFKEESDGSEAIAR